MAVPIFVLIITAPFVDQLEEKATFPSCFVEVTTTPFMKSNSLISKTNQKTERSPDWSKIEY